MNEQLPKRRIVLVACCLALAGCVPPREATRERDPSTSAPRTSEASPRMVQGFRVQIHLTPEKTSADAYVAEALAWWRGLAPQARPAPLRSAAELPVEVAWRAPYYRVRVGAFPSREGAEATLAALRGRFPDAMLVPDMVPVAEGHRPAPRPQPARSGDSGKPRGW